MSKKVLLINPPKMDRIRSLLPGFEQKQIGFYPPLGILYLAGYALKTTEHQIEILDCEAEELNYDDIEKRIRCISPDIVGITSLSFIHVSAINVAKIVRRVDSAIKIVFGGTHPSIYPKETASLDCVDYVVVGEGEYLFTQLINKIEKGEHCDPILYQREFIEDLDNLPFPRRDLLKQDLYSSVVSKQENKRMTLLFTSRGCPYKCLFCDRPNMGKVFRYRSARNVVDEIEECVGMGIGEFLIYDDTFTVNKKRVADICNEIIERKLNISWDVRARVDTVNPEMLALMKKAGCHTINFGVEAASERILKILRKNISPQAVKNAFQMAQNAGLKTIGYFILGSPSETREEVLHTIQFALDLKPDLAHFAIMTPFPQTELYTMGLEKGILKEDFWKKFAASPDPNFIPPFWDEVLSEEELIDLFKLAYKKFYYSPAFIFRKLLSIQSSSELFSLIEKGFIFTKSFILGNEKKYN